VVNTQGLFAVSSVFSLLIFVPLGLVRFAVDWWSYHHTSNAANLHLNYEGLVMAANGVFLSAICLLIFFLMELRFRRRLRSRQHPRP
jgi:hypothetical protein